MAIIICYFGNLPWYFHYFVHSGKYNPLDSQYSRDVNIERFYLLDQKGDVVSQQLLKLKSSVHFFYLSAIGLDLPFYGRRFITMSGKNRIYTSSANNFLILASLKFNSLFYIELFLCSLCGFVVGGMLISKDLNISFSIVKLFDNCSLLSG